MKQTSSKNELLNLMNVGKAVYKDLEILNITNVRELSKQDPDILYKKLQKITKKRHDPCMWDVFAAIIHEAKTGEKTPWWEWTKIRKNKVDNWDTYGEENDHRP